jgi:hypothetical protein
MKRRQEFIDRRLEYLLKRDSGIRLEYRAIKFMDNGIYKRCMGYTLEISPGTQHSGSKGYGGNIPGPDQVFKRRIIGENSRDIRV